MNDLSKREFYAVMAMLALVARAPVRPNATDVAVYAKSFADALEKELRS